jgi:hypothetical protein
MIDEKFSGVTKLGDNLLINHLESNFKSFLEWGFLNIGGFINVKRSVDNLYDSSFYKLKPIEDPNYTNGQVWQTCKKDWVWESGIVFDSNSPINISGIYIDNNFYPTGIVDPEYSYKLDYHSSYLIFDSPIDSSSVVTMDYSYRWVQVYNYIDASWWQELQFDSDRDKAHFDNTTGDFVLSSNQRVQLPAIVVETVSRGRSEPYRLGDKSLIVFQDILLHILAENLSDRNTIIDIMRLQQDKVIWLYNIDQIISNNISAFNFDGTLNNNRVQYDNILKNTTFQWKRCKINDIIVSEVSISPSSLSEATIRLTAEIIFDEM